jgi:hypothetical protein
LTQKIEANLCQFEKPRSAIFYSIRLFFERRRWKSIKLIMSTSLGLKGSIKTFKRWPFT